MSIRERTTLLPALKVRFCLRKVADQCVYKHVRITCDAAKMQFKKISLDGDVLKYKRKLVFEGITLAHSEELTSFSIVTFISRSPVCPELSSKYHCSIKSLPGIVKLLLPWA